MACPEWGGDLRSPETAGSHHNPDDPGLLPFAARAIAWHGGQDCFDPELMVDTAKSVHTVHLRASLWALKPCIFLSKYLNVSIVFTLSILFNKEDRNSRKGIE